jgi:hypothetical protein
MPQTEQQRNRFDLFEVYETYFRLEDTPYTIIVADSLNYENYKAETIEIYLDYNQGSIFIPHLSMNIYDGNLVMRSYVNLNSGALEDISYFLQGQLSRVNSSILPGVIRQEEEESRIGVTFDMLGQGFDLSRKISLEGKLEVTEIGSQATTNLLKSIDPFNADPSIRSVRRMLSLGYKPKTISFIIQYGNFYPSISFSQPWFSPIRISGGKISISRLPLKLLLDLMAAEKGAIM